MKSFDDQTTKYPRTDLENKLDNVHSVKKRLKVDHQQTRTIVKTIIENLVEEKQTLLVNTCTSRLEMLPNELMFLIIDYLSSLDTIQAFYDLNQRFNAIIFESFRHFTIPNQISIDWLHKYMSCINNAIETIRIDVQSVPSVFLGTYSYQNLHSIILKCSCNVTVELQVENLSILDSITSCLNLLRLCKILSVDHEAQISCFCGYQFEQIENEQAAVSVNTLPCPAIVRLSLTFCEQLQLLRLCASAPNLSTLKILNIYTNHLDSYYSALAVPISPTTRLVQLHIVYDNIFYVNVNFVKRLIDCYASSLEYLSLNIRTDQLIIEGEHLQTFVQRCQHLKKMIFVLQHKGRGNDAVEQMRQFQSDWWLDDRQPPVLILCNDNGRILISSMPCIVPISFNFSIDLKAWQVNKGQLDSSLIYFTKVKLINFENTYEQPITLDLLHIVGRIFRSHSQRLTFNYWTFALPHILFEQMMNTRAATPILPNVKYLHLNSGYIYALDAMTLVIWLLLAPNVSDIYLPDMDNTDELELVTQLSELLKKDKRVRAILDGVRQVNLYWFGDCHNEVDKVDVFSIFANIFPKAVIWRV